MRRPLIYRADSGDFGHFAVELPGTGACFTDINRITLKCEGALFKGARAFIYTAPQPHAKPWLLRESAEAGAGGVAGKEFEHFSSPLLPRLFRQAVLARLLCQRQNSNRLLFHCRRHRP